MWFKIKKKNFTHTHVFILTLFKKIRGLFKSSSFLIPVSTIFIEVIFLPMIVNVHRCLDLCPIFFKLLKEVVGMVP